MHKCVFLAAVFVTAKVSLAQVSVDEANRRMQERIAARATAATQPMPVQPGADEAQLAALRKENAALHARLDDLSSKVKDLEAKLGFETAPPGPAKPPDEPSWQESSDPSDGPGWYEYDYIDPRNKSVLIRAETRKQAEVLTAGRRGKLTVKVLKADRQKLGFPPELPRDFAAHAEPPVSVRAGMTMREVETYIGPHTLTSGPPQSSGMYAFILRAGPIEYEVVVDRMNTIVYVKMTVR